MYGLNQKTAHVGYVKLSVFFLNFGANKATSKIIVVLIFLREFIEHFFKQI